jgi:signal peptidase II
VEAVQSLGRKSKAAIVPTTIWFLGLVVGVTAIDLATTQIARRYLSDQPQRTYLAGIVTLHLVDNTGAAFGLGTHVEWMVEIVEVGLLALAVWFAHKATPLVRGGLALVIGGGLGNLIVRLTGSAGPLRSPVVDWIHLSFYPTTFNLADATLRIGIIVVLVGLVLAWRNDRGQRLIASQGCADSAHVDESIRHHR